MCDNVWMTTTKSHVLYITAKFIIRYPKVKVSVQKRQWNRENEHNVWYVTDQYICQQEIETNQYSILISSTL